PLMRCRLLHVGPEPGPGRHSHLETAEEICLMDENRHLRRLRANIGVALGSLLNTLGISELHRSPSSSTMYWRFHCRLRTPKRSNFACLTLGTTKGGCALKARTMLPLKVASRNPWRLNASGQRKTSPSSSPRLLRTCR